MTVSSTSPARELAPLSTAERRLYELWGEIQDVKAAMSLHHWDQETHMPAGGQEARGQVLGTLSALSHRLLTAPELGDVLDRCAEEAAPGSLSAAQVRCARREVERAVKLPEDLVRALARAGSAGLAAWKRARQQDDFRLFRRQLAELVHLKRQEAAALADGGNPYDALLDYFEPGATEAALAPLFARLRQELGPLVVRVAASGVVIDESPACGHFPAEAQRRLAVAAATAFGFRFEAGRLDRAAHPFAMGLCPDDVRLTWRLEEGDFRSGLYAVLHETGHGLYEQGLPRELARTPVDADAGYGIHESQSRLWENHVGRSRGFWRWLFPRFRQLFPAAERDLDRLWPTVHVVRPSLIRVEADEVTYNLHVAVRFELERALFAGRLEVDDLPAAWSELYRELLGVTPPSDRDGVLQDVHWSDGLFGYFPTYSLGSMAAAQLFAAAERELAGGPGGFEEPFAEGDFAPLLAWLREKIHQQGARYPAPELVERATGEPLSPEPLLGHLTGIVDRNYGESS